VKLLDAFIALEDQAQFFFKVGPIIATTKGAGKGWETIDGIKENLKQLGIGVEKFDQKIPIDVRYLLTGDREYRSADNVDQYYHKITANNIRIVKEVDALSRTMFMERTPSYQFTLARTVANMKSDLYGDKVDEMRDELTSFAQIAAYKQWINIHDKKTSTLRNSLIYDSLSPTLTIVEIAKQAIELSPNNTFLKFILPVSTTVKVGKRNTKKIINRDLINTIEGKTRGRLEPDLIADMMDSFTELYQNPRTQYHAKALFDYLIVKDGLMFKNKSFIKMLPTIMFKEMSDATGYGTRLMAANTMDEYRRILNDLRQVPVIDKEGNAKSYFTREEQLSIRDAVQANDLLKVRNALYKKVFGFDYGSLYNRFEQIYATDIRHQFNIELAKTRVKSPETNQFKQPDGITFAKVGNDTYINVSMRPDSVIALKGDEFKQKLGSVLKELDEAGFPVSENSITNQENSADNRYYLDFKKFIRVREASPSQGYYPGETVKPTYTTYQLISVERDKTSYNGAAMTVEGELVPRGTFAVYKPITPVGTANTTGVADLGPRPTKDEITAIIEQKSRRNNGDSDAANYVDPPTNPTPGTDGGAMSDESGMSLNRSNDEPVSQHPFTGDETAPEDINSGTPISQTSLGKSSNPFGDVQAYDPKTDGPLPNFTDEDIDKDPC
jgi:hypothetical protein